SGILPGYILAYTCTTLALSLSVHDYKNNHLMKRSAFVILLLIALSGCKHYYYAPTTQNVPLFKEKNEFRATISSGGGDETSTTDFQAAYSITNKFGVIANFMTAEGGDESSDNRGEGRYFEAGFGYYKPFYDYGVFEVFVGVGRGHQRHYYEDTNYGWNSSTTIYSGMAEMSLTRIFLQPSIGITLRGLDFAFTPAISRISFDRIVNKIDTSDQNYFSVNNLSLLRNSYLFEPGLTIRFGWKYVKLQLQYLSIQNLSHRNLDFERTKLSVGLTFAFADRFRARRGEAERR
ncbi:MAG: hypothetical protein ACKVOK_07510, partial [Flavobacteriales bacterium]